MTVGRSNLHKSGKNGNVVFLFVLIIIAIYIFVRSGFEGKVSLIFVALL